VDCGQIVRRIDSVQIQEPAVIMGMTRIFHQCSPLTLLWEMIQYDFVI
jgi:hypothetical protein